MWCFTCMWSVFIPAVFIIRYTSPYNGDESGGKLIVINSCVFSSISDGGFKESLNSLAHVPREL